MSLNRKQIDKLFVHPNKVVETVQAQKDAVPIRQYQILFPIWDVNVTGQQREAHEYDFLERFIERGIAQAGFHSTEELARFYGISQQMVAKIVSFLRTVNHIEGPDHQLTLTPLAQESLRDQVFYRSLETQRKLYFDAFGSRPLPRAHYDLHLLTLDETMSIKANYIYRIYNPNPDNRFDNNAINRLIHREDRIDFNLPDEIEITNHSSPLQIYIPLTIIETRVFKRTLTTYGHSSTTFERKFWVMSRIQQGGRDHFFEEIINNEPALSYQFVENSSDDNEQKPETTIRKWIENTELADSVHLRQAPSGIWQVVIDKNTLQASNSKVVNYQNIGAYRQERGHFFQLWSDDDFTRTKALMEQTRTYARTRLRDNKALSKQNVINILTRNSEKLQVHTVQWHIFEAYLKQQKDQELLEEWV